MSFLLDTDICSAHMRRPSGLMHRFVQHGGQLHLPAIALAELYAGAHLLPDPAARLAEINDFISAVRILEFDVPAAQAFGRLRGEMKRLGRTVNPIDLLIASTALAHDLTLVTHNVKHFQCVPGLRIEDWLAD